MTIWNAIGIFGSAIIMAAGTAWLGYMAGYQVGRTDGAAVARRERERA